MYGVIVGRSPVRGVVPGRHDLVELGEERSVDQVDMFGVSSSGCFFAMASADQVKASS